RSARPCWSSAVVDLDADELGQLVLGELQHLHPQPAALVDDEARPGRAAPAHRRREDRKSTRLNSSHLVISYAVFCLKKKTRGSSLDQKLPTTTHAMRFHALMN